MPNYTGKDGSIQLWDGTAYQEVMDCTSWSFSTNCEIKAYASCSTNGQESVLPGKVRGEGSLSGYTDDTNHISSYILAGDEVRLRLLLNSTHAHIIDVVITEVGETVQIENQDIVGWTASFRAKNGWQLFQTV